MRPPGEPGGGQAGQQRLALGDADEGRRAGERHCARGEQFLRLLGQPQQVETVGDQPLALPDEAGDSGLVAVLVGKALVGARLLDWVQVGADHVLGDGERQRLPACLAHLGGHLLELRLPRRPVAALPGDDREAVVSVRASVSGVMTPCRLIDSISSAMRSSAKSLRGLKPFLALILARGTMVSVALITLRSAVRAPVLERLWLSRALEAGLACVRPAVCRVGWTWST